MAVSNVWHVLNLRSTPFFQEALEPGTGARYPLSLFVGRDQETAGILAEIGGSSSSRTAIQGAPGVGKTTLVNHVKSQVADSGYVANAATISVASASTAEEMLLKILTSVHDALVARDVTLFNHEPMREVRQLLHAERSGSFSLSATLPGIGGAGAGAGQQRHTGAGALTVQPARLLRKLSDLAVDHLGTPGVLIHLNNLENLTDADRDSAARIVRDLRDVALMQDGFHYLLVGTDDAIRTIVAAQEQLRSVFHAPAPLAPLTHEQVVALLEARYHHLRLSDDRPPLPPVTTPALRNLYDLFEGNLRGTLHALNESAKSLVGHGDTPTAPMTMEAMLPVLHHVYAGKMAGALNATETAYLRAAAEQGFQSVVTQAELTKRLNATQKTTSDAVGGLRAKGFLSEAGTMRTTSGPGRPAQTYRLTGVARLALALGGGA